MSRWDPRKGPELITLPSAARRAGVGIRELRRACARGKLKFYRPSAKERAWPKVRWIDVLAWIESRRVPITPHAERVVAKRLQHEAEADRV